MRPELGSFAEEFYGRLEPFHERINPDGPGTVTDEQLGWPLLIFFGLWAARWQEIEDLIRDTDDGPGWSALVSIDRIPDKGLPYLSQFLGKQLIEGMTPAEQRDRIRSTDGFDRGTPSAMEAAGKRNLTGQQRIYINERLGGSVWHAAAITYVDETPDPVLTFSDMLEQKHHGVILTHTVVDEWGYDVLKVAFDDYGQIKVYYADYTGLKTNVPPAPGT